MSDINLARRTALEVFFSGVNISESMREYLISLTYTDNEEDAADDLQINLHDRGDIWLTSWLQQAIEAAASANLSAESVSGSSATATYKVTSKSGLLVRNGPSANYKKLGALTYGAEIEVIAIVGGWASVSYNGATAAFAQAKYLAVSNSAGGKAETYAQIKYGSTGADVKTMKGLLATLGYDLGSGSANDKYDSATVAAVKAFQKAYDLTVDGICGPFTWTALLKATQGSRVSGGATTRGLRIQAAIACLNWQSDGNDAVLDCGEFELDSVTASGPPSSITIKGTALPYNNSIRQTKKSRGWEAYTLAGIAKEMADKNGMAGMFESTYNPYYARVEQIDESDISFLSQLCHNAGISLKATNNIIVLFDQAVYEQGTPVMTIQRGVTGYKTWKLGTGKADTQYAVCRVSYTNPTTGKVIEGFAYADDYDPDKESNQTLEITAAVGSIAEAEALAAKRLRLNNKYGNKATFTLPGNTALLAGITVMLVGWGAWDGKYIISQAKHTVSGGYTTNITLRKALEGY